ncbi:MAG: ISL3 family transposase [Eubacterium sp.]
MKSIMNIPGLKDVLITKIEEIEEKVALFIEIPKSAHSCPVCQLLTSKIHDDRMQKISHLKWFERQTVLYYKRRRYVCSCGKRFSEKSSFIERYQRFSKEWNQAIQVLAIKSPTFKSIAEKMGTSSSTVIRRFDRVAKKELLSGVTLPKAIAIDEYKGDTNAGKFQLIIANAETHEPIDILPNRRKDTIKHYLQKHGDQVEIVVMDMNQSFKAAVKEALNRPVIIADRFHYCRSIYWALDKVRRTVQLEWHAYDRKRMKRMRYVFYKREAQLNEKQLWELNRYRSRSPLLKSAHELKEAYCEWFDWAKKSTDMNEIKERLLSFYRKVTERNIPAFNQVMKTLKNWQTEILNSFAFGYSNGFLEGINNKTKVMKRNAYGYKRFDRFRAKILLTMKYKEIGLHLG